MTNFLTRIVSAVQHLHLGHVHVEYSDGSQDVIPRGKWEHLDLKPGATLAKKIDLSDVIFLNPDAAEILGGEKSDAVDAPASEVPAQQGVAAQAGAEGQNESGAAPESGDGAQAQGIGSAASEAAQ